MTSTNPLRKHLVLLGAGRAHLQVLKGFARRMPVDTGLTLVATTPYYIEPNMLSGYVAGHYGLDDFRLPLDTLVEASGAAFVQARVQALDPAARRVQLSTGDALPYDVASIDVEPEVDRERLDGIAPGARHNALLTRPLEAFVQLWPQVRALAQTRALQVAVITHDLGGVELAMAAAQALANPHGSRVTLVAGKRPLLEALPNALARRIEARLKRLNVTVLQDDCTGIDQGAVRLAGGATLACDAPIWSADDRAPSWLRQSGLQLDDTGELITNARLQSESHRQVFIAPHTAPAEAGAVLEGNLRTALLGGSFKKARLDGGRLHAVGCGDKRAIVSWGPLSLEGREVWHWKDRRDRRQLTQLLTL